MYIINVNNIKLSEEYYFVLTHRKNSVHLNNEFFVLTTLKCNLNLFYNIFLKRIHHSFSGIHRLGSFKKKMVNILW